MPFLTRMQRPASANGSQPVWSPEAIEDIESITAHIEPDSLWYAKAVATKIVETAETILDCPEIGRAVPEIGNSAIRERFVYSYRIVDRIEPERILVAAVIQGSRLLQPFAQRINNPSLAPLVWPLVCRVSVAAGSGGGL